VEPSSGGGVDLSELHIALDKLRRQLCICNNQGDCIACKGIEMVRQQAQAVIHAASQPALMQVVQEAAAKDMAAQFEGMTERLMNDPEMRRAAEAMQEQVMSDPETRKLLEDLMKRLGGSPPEG